MTYNVFGGTLSLTQSISFVLILVFMGLVCQYHSQAFLWIDPFKEPLVHSGDYLHECQNGDCFKVFFCIFVPIIYYSLVSAFHDLHLIGTA